jgi:hypothetical protein
MTGGIIEKDPDLLAGESVSIKLAYKNCLLAGKVYNQRKGV